MKENLTGGREGIFVQDNCVHRPSNPWSPAVHDFLDFMQQTGFTRLPKPVSINENEEVLSFVPGQVFDDPLPDFFQSEATITSAARLLRDFHAVGQAYLSHLTGNERWMLPAQNLAGPPEVMCHGDFAPYNVTIQNQQAWSLIDFDTLQPGSRLWDVTYAVYRWTRLMALDATGFAQACLFLETYGLANAQRAHFTEALVTRLEALCAFMENQAAAGNTAFQQHIKAGHLQKYQTDIALLQANAARINQALLQN